MAADWHRDVVRELKKLGYERVPGKKHEKWRFAGDSANLHGRAKIVIVPRKLEKRHTANGILKNAGSDMRV